MPNLVYHVLNAVSLRNQMDMIKKLVEEYGWTHTFKTGVSIHDLTNENNGAFLWFTLGTNPFLSDAIAPYTMCSKPKAVYVTLEGFPLEGAFNNINARRMKFITVSTYVKECLETQGLDVIDTIHHAIDLETVGKAKEEAAKIAKKWDEEFGDKVRFICVSRDDTRKGLDTLAKAVAIANEKFGDKFIVLMFENRERPEVFNQPNIIKVGSFGKVMHYHVLALMGAAHYGIFPSKAEGFGEPVLENNAMSKPVVHAWFPPLSEFSSKDFNYVFDHSDEVLIKDHDYQMCLMHEYPPTYLAEMIMMAIDDKLNHPDTYEDNCTRAGEHALNWEYHKIYPKLLSHLRIEKKEESAPVESAK
jgi:hypothetical protein